jgi:hypothetical protein
MSPTKYQKLACALGHIVNDAKYAWEWARMFGPSTDARNMADVENSLCRIRSWLADAEEAFARCCEEDEPPTPPPGAKGAADV